MPSSADRASCSPGHTTPLCHGSVLLLEAVAQSLGALHVLVDASHHAALLARGEGLAFEAVDAVVEALLDEVGVHLRARSAHVPRTVGDRGGGKGKRAFINSFICFFSMRACSSRCSFWLRLVEGG